LSLRREDRLLTQTDAQNLYLALHTDSARISEIHCNTFTMPNATILNF